MEGTPMYLSALEALSSEVGFYLHKLRKEAQPDSAALIAAYEWVIEAKTGEGSQPDTPNLMERYYGSEMTPELRREALRYMSTTTSDFPFITSMREQFSVRGSLTDPQSAALLNCQLYEKMYYQPKREKLDTETVTQQ